ncbi:TonB-dependent receptor [Alkalimonas mucilaginosa]|uniref:TonB-dependent receptor n=1 Tax=Alkalimonas mucilaginosa TaxID=3057676 RepID=A0ABU7JIA6_9GAMM|nr:TonB-dependent receptor [Alkalimonas sp. MEB004]MEE2025426.1 TonB-dependent receptor [Alkalimonas sp. MEB004]
MTRKKQLTWAIQVAMAGGLLGLGTASPIYAADSDTIEQTVERIEVTGSRIKRTDLEGVAPVTVISAAEIEASGFTSVEELLQASVFNSGRTIEGNESSWTQGANTINMRGMGANRTLVLVNGKRVPQYPTATGGSSNFVDTSTFPTSAIERIEILSGGASAIYGSDAIGGVVNIILKSTFERTQLDLRHENPQLGGRDKSRATLTHGMNSRLGQTMFVLEYRDDEMLRRGQRDFTQVGGPDGTDTFSSTSAYLRDYSRVFHNQGQSGSATTYIMANEQQCQELFGSYGIWNDDESRYKCRYDSDRDASLHTGKREWNLVMNHQGELNSDWSYNIMLQGSDRETTRGNGQKSVSPTFYMDQNNPGVYSYDASDFEQSREFRVYRRLDDYGQRRDYTGLQKSLNSSIGLQGRVGDYDLELSWAYGKSTFERIGRNQMRADRLLEVISFDPADSANPDKWYPLDKMTPAQVEHLYAETLTDAGSGMNQLSAVLTGDLFELPAGTVQFAWSAEWAREWYFDHKDEHTLNDNLLGQGGTQGRGDRKRYATAGELALPLLDQPGGWGQLEASLALRYDRYDDQSDVGGALTPQAGLVYRPTENTLFRLNGGKSFRAPDLHRLYAGPSRSFTSTNQHIDPNHPADVTDQFESITAGNVDLEEEKGKFFNLGVVAQLTDDLSMSLDYWRISLTGAVYRESVQRVLENPAYDMTGQASNCRELESLGYIMQQQQGNDYLDILCVRRGEINSSYEASQGIDFEVEYRMDLGDYGRLRWKADLSHTLKKEYQSFAEAERIDETKDDYLPAWKAGASVRYSLNDLNLNLSWHYLGSAEGWHTWTLRDEDNNAYTERVWSKLAPYTRVNLNGSYQFNRNLRLTLGINNLTNTMPPQYVEGHPSRNSQPYFRTNSGYNVVGRTFYGAVRYQF